MWYNQNQFGADMRTIETGWFQGCGGKVPYKGNKDWDIIEKTKCDKKFKNDSSNKNSNNFSFFSHARSKINFVLIFCLR